MCGIFGIIAHKNINVQSKIIESLDWLSYRGYDSAGMAIKRGNKLEYDKDIVEDNERIKGIFIKAISGNVGIGHTRWATHGEVNKINAHPHYDCSEQIAVVHNGIINNFDVLKKELKLRNHKFISNTDTEVISHIIEEKLKNYPKNSKNQFLYAFRDTILELKGTFAIAAIWTNDIEDQIYACRNFSPLILGLGKKEFYISSDIPAFLPYTNNFIPLEDNQICVISSKDFHIYNLTKNCVDKEKLIEYNKFLEEIKKDNIKIYKFPYTIESIEKGNYPYYMEKEIEDQPSVLNTIYNIYQNKDLSKVVKFFKKNEIQKVYLTGCGSSFYSCLVGKYIFERILKIPTEAILSSEFSYTPIKQINDKSILIGISQSGETYDTKFAINYALKNGAKAIGITNLPVSSLERLINKYKKNGNKNGNIIRLNAGIERCVVATKTYTAQLYLLSLLAMEIAKNQNIRLNPQYEIQAKQLPTKLREIFNNNEIRNKISQIINKYNKFNIEQMKKGQREGFFTIGRGINYPTALEGSLKLKEICYVYSEGLPGGELKHGSLAVVDKNTPTIVLLPPYEEQEEWDAIFNNLMEIRARKGPIISIHHDLPEKIKKYSEYAIRIPETNWLFSPILQIIPLQLMAYELCLKKGLNPDFPRNLAKTVTTQ